MFVKNKKKSVILAWQIPSVLYKENGDGFKRVGRQRADRVRCRGVARSLPDG